MRHEKVIKREDGKKVRIEIKLGTNWYSNIPYWYEVQVRYKDPRKRLWLDVFDGNDFRYRRLDSEGRKAFILEQQLLHATPSEILEAKLELWNLIKPC